MGSGRFSCSSRRSQAGTLSLPWKSRTCTFYVVGKKNALSTGKAVDIDALIG